jgi:hypothetical protein
MTTGHNHVRYFYQFLILFCLFKNNLCQVCYNGTLRVSPDKTDERLNGSVIITFTNIGPNMCFDECIRRPRCHSINYNMDTFYCELNKEPVPANEVFQPYSGYEYVETGVHRGVSHMIYNKQTICSIVTTRPFSLPCK